MTRQKQAKAESKGTKMGVNPSSMNYSSGSSVKQAVGSQGENNPADDSRRYPSSCSPKKERDRTMKKDTLLMKAEMDLENAKGELKDKLEWIARDVKKMSGILSELDDYKERHAGAAIEIEHEDYAASFLNPNMMAEIPVLRQKVQDAKSQLALIKAFIAD